MATPEQLLTRDAVVEAQMDNALTRAAPNPTQDALFAQLAAGPRHLNILELFRADVYESILRAAVSNDHGPHVNGDLIQHFVDLGIERIVHNAPALATAVSTRPANEQLAWNQFLIRTAFKYEQQNTIIPTLYTLGAFAPTGVAEQQIADMIVPGSATLADAMDEVRRGRHSTTRDGFVTAFDRALTTPANLREDAQRITTEVERVLPAIPDNPPERDAEAARQAHELVGHGLVAIGNARGRDLCWAMVRAIDAAHPRLPAAGVPFEQALTNLLIARVERRAEAGIRQHHLEQEIQERAVRAMHALVEDLRGPRWHVVGGRRWAWGRIGHEPPADRRQRAFEDAAHELFTELRAGAIHLGPGAPAPVQQRELQRLLGVNAGGIEAEIIRRMDHAWNAHNYGNWLKSLERYRPDHEPAGVNAGTVSDHMGHDIMHRIQGEFPEARWNDEDLREELAARTVQLFLDAQMAMVAGSVDAHPGIRGHVTNFIRSHRTVRGVGGVALVGVSALALSSLTMAGVAAGGALLAWPALVDAWKSATGAARYRREGTLENASLNELVEPLAAHTAMAVMETIGDKRNLANDIGMLSGAHVANVGQLDAHAELMGNATFSPRGNMFQEPWLLYTHRRKQRNGRVVFQAYANRLHAEVLRMLRAGSNPEQIGTFITAQLRAFFTAWENQQRARRRTNAVKWFVPYNIRRGLASLGTGIRNRSVQAGRNTLNRFRH